MRPRPVWAWTLAASLLGARCLQPNASGRGLTLLATGDWGGENDDHPTTPAQVATSKGMGRAARALGADMVLLLGDNFYSEGVRESTAFRFRETFEKVFASHVPAAVPFWLIAGNHDHLGDVQLQIKHSRSHPRWKFPAQFYSITRNWTTGSGERRSVELLMIDTVALCGNSDGGGERRHSGGPPQGDTATEKRHRNGGELAGPDDERLAHQQWYWLKERLKSSTADFLWVCGHYPLYSAGDDGTTSLLVSHLLPLLKAHGAHYLSGHDHMFEHLLYDGVHMVVAGAGMECCYNDSRNSTVPDGALQFMVSGMHGAGASVGQRPPGDILGGFSSFHFSDDAAHVSFHKEDGQEIHSLPPIPRRALPEGFGSRRSEEAF